MKKTTLFITTILLAVSFGSAATITPENQLNYTLNPNNQVTQDYDIEFGENDTEVRVAATSTGDYDVSYNSFRIFDEDGTFSAEIQAPDTGNVTHNVTFSFEVAREGNLSTQTITREVRVYTAIPYETLQDPTWINKTHQLNVNGNKLNVSDIQTNLYFNNNSIQLSDTKTINDVRLELLDIIPGAYAKIKADSKVDDTTFSINNIATSKEPQPEPCTLGIRTITTLQRGNSFAIETIDDNSDDNEIIPGVSVTLIDSGKGEPIGNTQSGTSGYASMFIPEHTKGPVIARLAKADSNCESNNQRVSFNKPYNVYINNNEEFQLDLSMENSTYYSDITGSVTTAEGKRIGSGIIQIKKPNGDRTDVAYNKTGFSYTPNQEGDYTFTATKDGYVKSDQKTATYVADQDGDGISNNKDDCPSTEGVAANNGCPKKEVSIEVYRDDVEYNGVLRPFNNYSIRVVGKNGSKVDFTGEIPVENSEVSLKFKDGEVTNGQTNKVMFNNTGTYRLELNTSAYEPARRSLIVEKKGMFENTPIMPIIFGVLIIGGIVVLFYLLSNSGGKTGKKKDVKYGFNLDELDGDS